MAKLTREVIRFLQVPTTQKMAWFVLGPLGNYDCHPTRTKAS